MILNSQGPIRRLLTKQNALTMSRIVPWSLLRSIASCQPILELSVRVLQLPPSSVRLRDDSINHLTPKMGGSTEIVEDPIAEQDSSFIRHSSSLAVCLVSGGMDSCVTAAIAREENEELAFLHISYGQRTEARERRAFEEVADFYGVARRLVVSLEHLARIRGSSLTHPASPGSEADLASRQIPTSYVPFRNPHLLSAA